MNQTFTPNHCELVLPVVCSHASRYICVRGTRNRSRRQAQCSVALDITRVVRFKRVVPLIGGAVVVSLFIRRRQPPL